MATFDEFYISLDPDSGIRGKQLEKFVKWFLKTDPVWKSQVKEVWLWDEHPKRSEWGPDCGIDLVFNDQEGKCWAVQAKCFSSKGSIKKKDIPETMNVLINVMRFVLTNIKSLDL